MVASPARRAVSPVGCAAHDQLISLGAVPEEVAVADDDDDDDDDDAAAASLVNEEANETDAEALLPPVARPSKSPRLL